jgi:hypothetical protein
MNNDDRIYSLLAILKYNINLDADEIKNFILYSDEHRKYLTVVRHIDSINFDKTINMLQDLNDLILMFYEKSTELKQFNPNTCTKKIYLHSKNKKTIKKRYKE